MHSNTITTSIDWLIDRRHCDVKWLGQVRPLREKVHASLLQLPEDDQRLTALRDKRREHVSHHIRTS